MEEMRCLRTNMYHTETHFTYYTWTTATPSCDSCHSYRNTLRRCHTRQSIIHTIRTYAALSHAKWPSRVIYIVWSYHPRSLNSSCFSRRVIEYTEFLFTRHDTGTNLITMEGLTLSPFSP